MDYDSFPDGKPEGFFLSDNVFFNLLILVGGLHWITIMILGPDVTAELTIIYLPLSLLSWFSAFFLLVGIIHTLVRNVFFK